VSALPGNLTGVSISLSLNPTHTYVGDLIGLLEAPTGTQFTLFSRVGYAGSGFGDSSDFAGPYAFADGFTGNLWTAAAGAGAGAVVPAGNYRTSAPLTGALTSLSGAFAGLTPAQANGTWRLIVRDAAGGDVGGLSAGTLTLVAIPETCVSAAGLLVAGAAVGAWCRVRTRRSV
jgi:hypothetical protein